MSAHVRYHCDAYRGARRYANPLNRNGCPPIFVVMLSESQMSIPMKICKMLWDVWSKSSVDGARLFCYRTHAAQAKWLACDSASASIMVMEEYLKVLEPALLVETLEHLANIGDIRPRLSREITERILGYLDENGGWR